MPELDPSTRQAVEGHLETLPDLPPLYAGLVGVKASLGGLRNPDTVVEEAIVWRGASSWSPGNESRSRADSFSAACTGLTILGCTCRQFSSADGAASSHVSAFAAPYPAHPVSTWNRVDDVAPRRRDPSIRRSARLRRRGQRRLRRGSGPEGHADPCGGVRDCSLGRLGRNLPRPRPARLGSHSVHLPGRLDGDLGRVRPDEGLPLLPVQPARPHHGAAVPAPMEPRRLCRVERGEPVGAGGRTRRDLLL